MAADTNSSQRVAYLRRRVHFSAAHVLWSPSLSDEENKQLFGKCTNHHGHNYIVDVTLRGKVDSRSGIVADMMEVKKALQVAVVDQLDHKDIDKDVPYFNHVVSTSENLVMFIWDQLKGSSAISDLLYEVCLHETVNNTFIYRGE